MPAAARPYWGISCLRWGGVVVAAEVCRHWPVIPVSLWKAVSQARVPATPSPDPSHCPFQWRRPRSRERLLPCPWWLFEKCYKRLLIRLLLLLPTIHRNHIVCTYSNYAHTLSGFGTLFSRFACRIKYPMISNVIWRATHSFPWHLSLPKSRFSRRTDLSWGIFFEKAIKNSTYTHHTTSSHFRCHVPVLSKVFFLSLKQIALRYCALWTTTVNILGQQKIITWKSHICTSNTLRRTLIINPAGKS